MVARRRILTTLFAIVFTDLVGFGIVIPMLPLYAERYDPQPWLFGLLMASFSAMQFLFAPILGRLSDRVGRRPVLLVSLGGAVAGYSLFAVADSLALLFASRIVAGIAGANIATAQAVIADLTEPQERARGMGLIGAAFGLGFIAGPALSGLLVTFGPAAPGFGAAFCSAAALLMTVFFLPESAPRGSARGAPSVWGGARLALALRRRDLAPLLALGLLVVGGMAVFEVTFAQFLHARIALSPSRIAFVFVYAGVLAALVQGAAVGRLARRFGENTLLFAGLALSAVGLALLAATPSLGWLLAVLPLLAFGQGLTMPTLSAMVSRRGDRDDQGEILGAYQGVNSFARIVGPLAGEVAYGMLGTAAPPLLACALAVAALAGAAAWLRGQ
ncbi:MAG: MFS transporter [Acidobacteriota bacterium]